MSVKFGYAKCSAFLINSILTVVTCFFISSASAQDKNLYFNQIQSRNDFQQWELSTVFPARSAHFSKDSITVSLDRDYKLFVRRASLLPDDGTIFLCSDENNKTVTVLLIGEHRLFLYNDVNRFQIDFIRPSNLGMAH